MLKRAILFICIILMSVKCSFYSKNKRYVVVNNAAFYGNYFEGSSLGNVPPGFSFYSLDQNDLRTEFRYKQQKVWIDNKDIILVDTMPDLFSKTSILYSDTPVANNQDMWFFYKNSLYKMDIKDPQSPVLSFQGILPNILDIKYSHDRKKWLLIGDDFKNGQKIINLALFIPEKRKEKFFTFFYGNNLHVNSIEFSQNGKYLAIFLTVDDVNFLQIYDVNLGMTLFVVDDLLDYNWFDNHLIVYTDENISLFDRDMQGDILEILYHYDKKENVIPSVAFIENEMLINIDSTIYKLVDNKLELTPFKSLERNGDGTIEYYQSNSKVYTTYHNEVIRSLSGENPPWIFLSIIGKDKILYNKKVGALLRFGLYDPKNGESKFFTWIENPQYVFCDEIFIESIVANDEVWIFFEKPEEWVHVVRMSELLK